MTRSYSGRQPRHSRPTVAPAPLSLNAFELTFERPLAIPIILYEVTSPTSSQKNGRAGSSGSAVNALWRHRSSHRNRCSGAGFIVGIDADAVAVSQNWDLPSGQAEGFTINRKAAFTLTDKNPAYGSIILAILRDAIKRHFKEAPAGPLGVLWRDYGDFCQMPPRNGNSRFSFCRKFVVRPRFLMDQRLVVQIHISTITLDNQPLASYYHRGHCHTLAALVESARTRIATREGDPPKFRLWHDLRQGGGIAAEVVDVANPDELIAHGELSESDQHRLAVSEIDCTVFPDKRYTIPLAHLRLIHGNWSTGSHHSNTILSPDYRATVRRQVVESLDGFAMHDNVIHVARQHIATSHYRTLNISPPAIQVNNEWGQPAVLTSPNEFSADLIRRRARERKVAVGRNGFLRSSPIKPLLAWPRTVLNVRRKEELVKQDLVESMRQTLNQRFHERRIEASFESYQYSNVDDLRQHVHAHGYDAVFAVLPEPSGHEYQKDDTHERIKQRIGVPSQCIHYDNTLSDKIASKHPRTFTKEDSDLFRRTVQQYDLCVDNLLVKSGWLPFLAAEPFRFNVHVGIDVGGKSNDTVVASVCHGLANPKGEIVFRVQRIPVDLSQAEPIPTHSLTLGLREVFDFIRSELDAAGQPTNFEDVLFFRDGAMLGKKDRWNEKDGLQRLWDDLHAEGLIDGTGVWAVAESHKRSELWRLEGVREGEHENPVVGQCLVGFERPDEALVCTTGQPYLTQGTAKPTIVRVHTVRGDVDIDSVLVDYIWEADMGFTKVDMGQSLPWILRIADSGAFQLSRAYQLTGITA